MNIFLTVFRNYEHYSSSGTKRNYDFSLEISDDKALHCAPSDWVPLRLRYNISQLFITGMKNFKTINCLPSCCWSLEKLQSTLVLLVLDLLRREWAANYRLKWKSWKNNSITITHLKNGLIILDLKFVKSLDIPCLQTPWTIGNLLR